MVISKVLITGGTGFVGKWIERTASANMLLTSLNRADYKEYDSTYLSWDWNYVIHLAPIAPTFALECAKRQKIRLLYASSGIVYHPENDSEYRRNKLAWEQECLESGADVVIARLFTFSGEGLDDNKALVAFEKAARANQQINIWGDGKTIRSYMHGATMGLWLWAILLHGERGEAYDVGSDIPITMLKLAQNLKKVYQYQSPIYIHGGKDPMPVYLPPNTAKTRRLLTKNVV